MLRICLMLALLASCAPQQRPREWTSNDWARLSQAVGEMEKK